jgi:FkbM family methyltransferase
MQTKVVRFVYSHRSLPKQLISILVRNPILIKLNGFSMYVRLDDWAVGARIAIKRSYEKHVTEAMRPFLKPGSVVVDIGANIGYYTLLAASQMGDKGKVISFEPNPANCKLLQMSLERNRFNNVVIYTYAVADIDGIVGLGMDDSNGSINRDDPASQPYQVRAVTLDDFLKDEPTINLIKMDVEGAEGLVLKGMRELLKLHQPIIFTEFSPYALPAISRISPEAYLNEWRNLGYKLFVIHKNSGRNHFPQSNDEIMRCFIESKSDHLDLITLPKHKSD